MDCDNEQVRIIRRRRLLPWLVASSLLIAACGGGSSDDSSSQDPTTIDDPVEWTPCGDVECGDFAVPVDHLGGENVAGLATLKLFRKKALADDAPVLLLVGDRSTSGEVDRKWGARALAERAALILGNSATQFDVVSVALRGSAEMVLPFGFPAVVGSLDIADDLELLRREGLNVRNVRVLAWGRGATAVAAWKMRHPSSISSMVLDSPLDPARPLLEQTDAQIEAAEKAAEWAVRWCASHLSCPVNAMPTNKVQLLQQYIDEGTASAGVTDSVVARAAEVALSEGKPNELWRAIAEAVERRGETLLALAGVSPALADVRPLCRDIGQNTAREMVARHEAAKPRYFAVGSQLQKLYYCLDIAEPDRAIGGVVQEEGVKGSRAMIVGSSLDPVWPSAVGRAMAKRNGWTWKSVSTMRHHVIGHERAITQDAMKFLAGD